MTANDNKRGSHGPDLIRLVNPQQTAVRIYMLLDGWIGCIVCGYGTVVAQFEREIRCQSK